MKKKFWIPTLALVMVLIVGGVIWFAGQGSSGQEQLNDAAEIQHMNQDISMADDAGDVSELEAVFIKTYTEVWGDGIDDGRDHSNVEPERSILEYNIGLMGGEYTDSIFDTYLTWRQENHPTREITYKFRSPCDIIVVTDDADVTIKPLSFGGYSIRNLAKGTIIHDARLSENNECYQFFTDDSRVPEYISASDVNKFIADMQLFDRKDENMYAISTINMRASYTLDSEIVGELSQGSVIYRSATGKPGTVAEGWSKCVTSDNRTVYIASEYLSSTKPTSNEPSPNPNNSTDTDPQGSDYDPSIKDIPDPSTPGAWTPPPDNIDFGSIGYADPSQRGGDPDWKIHQQAEHIPIAGNGNN